MIQQGSQMGLQSQHKPLKVTALAPVSSNLNLGSGQTGLFPLEEERLWFKSIILEAQG